MNCLTGESEDTRLSASEMKQLIDNVSSGGGLGWAGEQAGKAWTLALKLPLFRS